MAETCRTDERHISSLVVQAMPERLAAIADAIAGTDGAEVALTDPRGKLVVTLETATLADVTAHIDRIAALSGVAGATLVYHHIESAGELDRFIDADVHGALSDEGRLEERS